ncbi:MAG: Hsp70 family protein [Polyangiaceae bacterium]
MGIAVGIDLGTTNTVVGAVQDGKAMTLADENGRRLIPSVVSFHPSGKVLVGNAARERRLVDAASTVYSVKRLIGRTWDSDEVQKAKTRFAFEMMEGPKQSTMVVARGEAYTLPEISAFVLRQAKAVAERALGEEVDKAVITVPANFNDLQRAATKMAGKLAGLEVLRILNEPTAAAVAYGQSSQGASERIAIYDLGGGTFDITLLDLSGTVFEVLSTAGDMQLGGDDIDHVIAERMAAACLREHRYDPHVDPEAMGTLVLFAESLKRDLSTLAEATVEIPDFIRGAGGTSTALKFKLSRKELEAIADPFIERSFKVVQTALDQGKLTLAQLNRTILVGGSTRMPLVGQKVGQFFKKEPFVRINPDEVVALGAAIQASVLDKSARTRKARVDKAAPKPVEKRTPTLRPEPPPADGGVPSDILQAALPVVGPADPYADSGLPLVEPQKKGGAAADGSVLAKVGLVSKAVQTNPLDVEETKALRVPKPQIEGPRAEWFSPDELPAAPPPAAPAPPPPSAKAPQSADASLPNFQQAVRPQPVLVFPTAPEPPPPPPAQTRPGAPPPPPPQAPPARAAAPVAAPKPPPPPPLLIDVTPLSLSVETVGGYCDVLITRNTPVPCDKTRNFATARDNQTEVAVRVAQGEAKMFAENTYLGEVVLSGISPARRGEMTIAVTFEIDADGILNVKAKESISGKETAAKIQLVGAQTDPQELQEMVARQAKRQLG